MKLSKFNLTNAQAVIELFENVFTESESKEEGKLIASLVSDLINTTNKDDLLGFVAVLEGKIIGSIFFSRLMLPNDKAAFILSPVAVASEHQGKGVGQKLINFGLGHLKSLNVDLVFTYGDPDFYSKVGFEQVRESIVKAPFKLSHPEGWLAQSLNGASIDAMNGSVKCVTALNDQQYW